MSTSAPSSSTWSGAPPRSAGSSDDQPARSVADPPVVTPAEVAEAVPLDEIDGGANLRRRLLLVDLVALVLAWLPPMLLGLRSSEGEVLATAIGVGFVVVGLTTLYVNELYLARVSAFRSIELARIGRCVVITFVVGLAVFRVLHVERGARWLVLGTALMYAFLLIGRSAYRAWLTNARVHGRFVRRIVIAGVGDEARELVDMLRDHPDAGYRVAAVVGDRRRAEASGLGELWRGTRDETLAVMEAEDVTGVILAAADLSPAELNAVATRLQQAGMHVHLSSGLRGINYRRMRATPIAYEPLFYLEPVQLTTSQLFAKRATDLVVAGLGLVVVSPLLLVIAAAIKLDDRGPVLFKQQRVGRHGRVFPVYKFRTMVPNAESLLAQVAIDNTREGPLTKVTSDPRVTRVGRFLRSSSLDELPQLWNVVRGEMSLVGPRPALPSEVAQFDERLLGRTRVRPGITGLWQMEARDNPSFGAYRRLDLFYVDNWSFGLDIVILFGTVEQVVAKTVGSVVGRSHD